MPNRQRPFMVATRVTLTERALIDAAAEAKGTTVTALLREIVLPVVGREIAAHAAALGGGDTEACTSRSPNAPRGAYLAR